ncbi:MAG: ABC transporter permease [Deltaproteobacteria bacterium]|nr:ABC transporter permease [Deltaproteobacteria bacterium]
MLTLLRTVSLRRLREHPFRTALTVLGIGLGVAAFISVQMILDTMSDSYASMVETVAGKAQLQITGGEAGVNESVHTLLTTPDENGRLPVDGVKAALPTIQVITRYGEDNLLLLAVDTLNDATARDYEMTGEDDVEIDDPLAFLNSQNSLLLNREFAERHGIAIGQTIDLLTSRGKKPFDVKGLLRSRGTADTFGGNFALMDVFAAQLYFGRQGTFDSIDIILEDGASADAVADALARRLGDQYEVARPKQRSESVETMSRSFTLGLTVLSLVVLSMAGFIILNAVTTTVYQRIREIGILRMVGVTRARIWALFIGESIVLALLGSAIGVAVGYAAGRAAVLYFIGQTSSVFVPTSGADPTFHSAMVLRGTLLGIGVSILGAAWPSFRATRITPLEVVRFGPGLSMGRGAALRWWTGLAAVSAAATLVCLSYPPLANDLNGLRTAMLAILVLSVAATPVLMNIVLQNLSKIGARLRTPLFRMSSENVLRDLGRSSMTVAAFMVALAVMFQIYIFMTSTKEETKAWMNNALRADLVVTSSSAFVTRTSVPMEASLSDTVSAIPGVDVVRHMRFRNVSYQGSRISLLSIDFEKKFNPDRFLFIRGDRESALKAFLANEGVFISQALVIHHPNLGDAASISLSTPSGKHSFRILGVVRDYLSDEGVVTFNRPLYLEIYRDPLVDSFQVYLLPSADSDDVRREIDKGSATRSTCSF